MCISGALSHTTSGGLSTRGKVTILSSRQSADALQDLVNLTRPCYWRLLTRFLGQELLAFLFFFFFLGTGF